jgi:hypothetical protein
MCLVRDTEEHRKLRQERAAREFEAKRKRKAAKDNREHARNYKCYEQAMAQLDEDRA